MDTIESELAAEVEALAEQLAGERARNAELTEELRTLVRLQAAVHDAVETLGHEGNDADALRDAVGQVERLVDGKDHGGTFAGLPEKLRLALAPAPSCEVSPEQRREALLSLIPEGSLFLQTYGDLCLWAPEGRGYVGEDELRAGVYMPGDRGYVERGMHPQDHSFTVPAAETLSRFTIRDGTPLALVLDELVRLRQKEAQ